MTLGLASCGGSGSAATVDNDTIISKNLADSISIAQGNYIGAFVLADYTNFMSHNQQTFPKEDIVKGLQIVFGSDKNQATMMGMQIGMQMLQEVRQLEAQGIEIDHEMLISNFKRAFMQDSVNLAANTEAYEQYQALVSRAQTIIMARDKARKAAEPIAIMNEQVGRAFIDKTIAADSDVKTSASGLVYKITEKGDTTTITPSTAVALKYTEKKIDGTITYTTGDKTRSIVPSRLTDGLAEGIMMLGIGGKATLYVPAALAYGVDGLPQRAIGPNETVVYEIEISGLE